VIIFGKKKFIYRDAKKINQFFLDIFTRVPLPAFDHAVRTLANPNGLRYLPLRLARCSAQFEHPQILQGLLTSHRFM